MTTTTEYVESPIGLTVDQRKWLQQLKAAPGGPSWAETIRGLVDTAREQDDALAHLGGCRGGSVAGDPKGGAS